jgi:hypothetical protein
MLEQLVCTIEKSMIAQKTHGNWMILFTSKFLFFSTSASPVAGSGGGRKRLCAIFVKTKNTKVQRFVKKATHAPIQKTQAKFPVF